MKTSIIIITFNGTGKIPRLLYSLNDLTEKNFEVIIVDDGSSDHPEDLIGSLKLNYQYQVIHQENMGRAGAKNKGALKAQHELLWFIDDDMRVVPDSLAAHVKHHCQFKRTISSGTQMEDIPLMTSEIQKYKVFISNSWKEQIESASNPLSVDDLFMSASNVSMPRDLFDELHGFDERLRDAEDLDLLYRAHLAGVQVYYNAAAIGFHMDLITCKSYIIRNRQYLEAYILLRQLHPDYMKINKRMHISKPEGIKRSILSIISQPLFVNLIDRYNFFSFILPRKWRYRFYELLIFGLGRVFVNRKI